MLRSYVKRAVFVRHNSTKVFSSADIDSLLERVKNLTKENNKPIAKDALNQGERRPRKQYNKNNNNNREGGYRNNNNNREGGYRSNNNREGGYRNNHRQQNERQGKQNHRSERFQKSTSDESTGPTLKVGIDAESSISKRSAGGNIDADIGDLMLSTPGFDIPTNDASVLKQGSSRERGQRPDRYNSGPRKGYNNRDQGRPDFKRNDGRGGFRGDRRETGNFRGDNRPGFRKTDDNFRHSRLAPGLRNKFAGSDRNPRRRDNRGSRRGKDFKKQGASVEVKIATNEELLGTEYSPAKPTPASLLATSPLLSNDATTRVWRAIRASLQNSDTDLGAVFKGELREVNVSQYSEQLKSENLKQNASVVVNALNRAGRMDYSTKMQILGPLIGAAPVKQLPLKFKEIQQ